MFNVVYDRGPPDEIRPHDAWYMDRERPDDLAGDGVVGVYKQV